MSDDLNPINPTYMKNLVTILFLFVTLYAGAQVKVGDNPNTIDPNSILELESTNKGFLPPRVALNSFSSVAPLTGTVPAGMLVYSVGGTLSNGFYFWGGAEWKRVGNGELNVVPKTADATLTKSETFVLANNDITITLPDIAASDNGLSITVKNVGNYTDLITIKGHSSTLIDEADSSTLTRFCSQTFVANEGSWLIKNKQRTTDNLLDIGPRSSWTSISEAVEFLEEHMTGPTILRLGEETYEISETIVIDLPFALTFQGLSYGTATIAAAEGLENKPMFRCKSDCYFKMLQFDATTLEDYGTLPGEDAIRLLGPDTYNEVKDCTFDSFYNTILDSSNAELWVFETDISNAKGSGILIHSPIAGTILKVAETDFIGCNYGVNLSKGSDAIIQLASGGYYNSSSSDTAIFYQPTNFTDFSSISITGNSWNNTGKFVEGFDFARTDGRDANAILESNAGMADKNPSCNINEINNATATNTTSTSTWYKANWTNTSSTTTKWTIGNNRITYQPTNKRNAYIIIAGNLSSSSSTAIINLGIVKGGVSSTRYGETTLRITSANNAFQFSMVVYLTDITAGEYFELWVNSNAPFSTTTIQDIQWFVTTQ
jgi:hypothetical protein